MNDMLELVALGAIHSLLRKPTGVASGTLAYSIMTRATLFSDQPQNQMQDCHVPTLF